MLMNIDAISNLPVTKEINVEIPDLLNQASDRTRDQTQSNESRYQRVTEEDEIMGNYQERYTNLKDRFTDLLDMTNANDNTGD